MQDDLDTGERTLGKVIVVTEEDMLPDWRLGQCMALWRVDLPCPNRAEWRVENTTNVGWSDMCASHKEGFAALYPQAAVRYVALDTGGKTV